MGKTSIFKEDILERLKNDDDERIFDYINKEIYSLNEGEATTFIFRVLDIINNNIYKYTSEICDLSYQLLKYNLSPVERIEAFNYMIRAYFCKSQYKAVILIGKSILYLSLIHI